MSADLQRVIRIVFQGDNDTIRAFNQVTRDLNQMENMVRSVTGPMSDMADTALKIQGALATLGTAGIAFAVNNFKNFEDAMLKVKGIMGASEEEYQQLTSLTKELGASTRFTAQEAAQGLEFLALAGVKFEDSLAVLPEVLLLAQAAAVDLGTAADLVTNIMAGYNIEVGKTGAVTDILTATFTSANVNLTQLGEAMKMVGPIAATLGIPIEETAAIIGKLGDAGFQGTEGGTALRNILLGLADPGQTAQRIFNQLSIDVESLGFEIDSTTSILEALGVKIKDAGGNVRPFSEIMSDLDNGLGKIPDSADRAALLIEAFGRRGGPQMAALLLQGSESVSNLQNRIEGLGGVTGKIADEMESGIGGALRTIRSAFDAIGIELGESVSKQIDPAVRSISDLFRVIASEIGKGTLDPLMQELGDWASRFSGQIDRISNALPTALAGIDYSRLSAGFNNLAGSISNIFTALFQGLDPGDAKDLEKILQSITNDVGALADVVAGILNEWQPVFEFLGDLINRMGEIDRKTLEMVGGLLGAAQKIEFFADKLGFVKGQITLLAIELGYQQEEITTLGKIFDFLSENAVTAGTSLGALWDRLNILTNLLGMFRRGLESVDESLAKGFGKMDEYFSSATDKLRKFLNLIPGVNIEIEVSMPSDPYEESAKKILDSTDELESRMKDFKRDIPEILDIKPPEIEIFQIDLQKEADKVRDATDVITSAIAQNIEDLGVQEIPIELQVAELEAQSAYVIAQLQETSAIVQESIRWTAELDIAEVEANARIMEAAFTSIDNTMISTGETMLGLFSMMGDASLGDRSRIITQLADENRMRSEAHEKQMQMLDAQLRLMDERTRAMARGDAMIQIDGQGLQPHLEAFMWEVLAAIQIRVNEEGMDMLLGQS